MLVTMTVEADGNRSLLLERLCAISLEHMILAKKVTVSGNNLVLLDKGVIGCG